VTTDPTVLQEQAMGARPNGSVELRSFDQGVVETLGARVIGDRYYITIEGVEPPSGDPGIPVHFNFPEDLYANFRYPAFVISRDDIALAQNRLHPGLQQYRAPAKTALYVPGLTATGVQVRPDRMEMRDQATPYDLTYTINIYNSLRGGSGRRAANLMLDHVLRIWPTYGQVWVPDSTGEYRSYEAFNEGIVNLDDNLGISERVIQFAVTVRVEAEYDLSNPTVSRTATQPATTTLTRK
jgi:hypothetical protein